jgi:hypothetical protein
LTGGDVSGGAVSGGAVSGGAVSGGAVSGGAVSGGAVSGGPDTSGRTAAVLRVVSTTVVTGAAVEVVDEDEVLGRVVVVEVLDGSSANGAATRPSAKRPTKIPIGI